MNPKEYARIIHEKSILRKLIFKGNDIVNEGFEPYDDIDELIDFAESALFEIYNRRMHSVFTPVGNLFSGNVTMIEEWCKEKCLV